VIDENTCSVPKVQTKNCVNWIGEMITNEQFLKENQSEAFKAIGIWLGKDIKFSYANKPHYVEGIRRVYFNPLTNEGQWIECLMWYRRKICNVSSYKCFMACLARATESREALLIAILELIGD